MCCNKLGENMTKFTATAKISKCSTADNPGVPVKTPTFLIEDRQICNLQSKGGIVINVKSEINTETAVIS